MKKWKKKFEKKKKKKSNNKKKKRKYNLLNFNHRQFYKF